MKTIYIDCSMGAAGDMLTAALLELIPDSDKFIDKLNSIGIPNVTVSKLKSEKCGIAGTSVRVSVNGEEESEHIHAHSEHSHEHHHEHMHVHHHEHKHHHSSLCDIEHIVYGLSIDEKIKKDIMAVYSLVAEAESHVHGVPVTDIHFHEVGTMDAVADITAVCMLMNEIGAQRIIVSPIQVGSGSVKCAHGILPVPAPATAYILRNCPIYGGSIKSELCTPTGAALLKYFVSEFGDMPLMSVTGIGYGMGNKDFETANCVRVMLGEISDSTDTVSELRCNIDDMTAEEIGFAMDRLFDGGACEVYTVPVCMKKSRPGNILHIICKNKDKERIVPLIFKYTSTIGIREYNTKRYVLDRQTTEIKTEYGTVREKVSRGYGVTKQKYEYDDLCRIATEKGITLADVRKLADSSK